MNRTSRIRAALSAMLLAAGIAAAVPSGPATAGHNPAPGEEFFELDKLPEPGVTGKEIFDGLKSFVDDHTYRVTGTPHEITAGLEIHQEMESLGYDARTVTLGQNTVLLDDPNGVGAGLKVVMGIKEGTTRPDDWIMFVGHYDSVPQTIYGAYDNGSGTNLMRHLARAFKDVETNRTLVFAFYNGEEEGLLASARHAQYLRDQDQEITAVLGFDMVGIAYPVANPTSQNCLCIWSGSGNNFLQPVLQHVNFDFLGFPSGDNRLVRIGINSPRNSDERSFNTRGYPTLRWAGMHPASAYPQYHLPGDTIETIISQAGSEQFYEQGVENTLKSSYYTALALDNHLPEPDFALTTSGLTVSVDASLSTDQDGELSGFSWDFGDGTTAEGLTAEHTYAESGTYTVTLTVEDNLWPEVTRSAAITVTLG